ncbi:MAG: tetratricopeptide repeat protein [Anaerolineae bacterium]|nr:tetratricopeptide repeat protein [Anaerolineae bacterium]
MTMTRAARILVLVSNPLDAGINLGDDLARLREAVANLPYAVQFDVHVAEAGQVGDLLSRADRPPYDVLHYLGHGDLLQDGTGMLWFEDEAGQARATRDVALLTTLRPTDKSEFKLALISACHSESVLPAMRALGVRHVIAIEADQSVYELAAVAFYRRFYRALLTGASVREAFTAGRSAVFNDARLGAAAATEAAKFKLLPEGASHDERLFAGLPDGQATFDDLPALTEYPFHQQPVAYVGRSADMRDLIAQLNKRRAASVIGPSGVGKTELARQVARWLVARRRFRPEHVGFASLANVRTADEARAQIARALGLKPDGVGDDGALARLCPRDFLLIVDEAEGVIQGDGVCFRDILNALIGAPARPRVIVTSQTDPNMPKAPPLPVRRLSDDAAFWLFALNAGLSLEQLQRIPQADLLEVLGFVDRLPRAIELVARVWGRERGSDPDNLDLRPLLARLRREYDEVMRDPDYPDEVKSVTVGILLADDRLRAASAGAAQLYAYLALFPGGASKAGLSAIFGPQAVDWTTLIQAQSLVEMPFSYFPAPLNDLLYLPAPFRFFAERQLPDGAAPARDAIGEAALRWYLDAEVPSLSDDGGAPIHGWVNVLDAYLRGGGQAMGAFIARYDAERPSIEAWLDWGYAGEKCSGGLARSARLTAQLENLYVVTNVLHSPETRARLERALACARRCSDAVGEANVLKALGDLKVREDDLGGARQDYDAALAIYRAIGSRLGEANVLKARGDLKVREDDLQGAREDYDAALAIYRAIGSRLGEANVLQARGNLALAEGRIEDAIQLYSEAAAIHEEINDRLGLAGALGYLARALRAAGQPAQAVLYGEAALNLLRAIGNRFGQCLALNDQGHALYGLQLAEPACAAWWQALALAQHVNPPMAQRLTGIFGQIRQALGDGAFDELTARLAQDPEGIRLAGVQAVARDAALAAANELYEARRYDEARAAFQRIVDALPDDADALHGLGKALESLGRYEEALEACSRAAAAQPEVAMLRRNRASVLLRLGRYDEAEPDVAEAARLEPDHPFTRARQGALALARGEFAAAQAHFEAAIAARPDDSAGWQALQALARLGLGEAPAAQQAIGLLDGSRVAADGVVDVALPVPVGLQEAAQVRRQRTLIDRAQAIDPLGHARDAKALGVEKAIQRGWRRGGCATGTALSDLGLAEIALHAVEVGVAGMGVGRAGREGQAAHRPRHQIGFHAPRLDLSGVGDPRGIGRAGQVGDLGLKVLDRGAVDVGVEDQAPI